MAFGRSARSSTISTTNACRAGVSNALMIPWTICSPRTCHTVITPANVSAPSRKLCSIDRICVTTRMRCRCQRSTSTPAIGASSKRRDLPAEADDAEQQLRAGQAVDQPARRDARDPRPDQRHALPAEEEPVVAVPQGAGELSRARGHQAILQARAATLLGRASDPERRDAADSAHSRHTAAEMPSCLARPWPAGGAHVTRAWHGPGTRELREARVPRAA